MKSNYERLLEARTELNEVTGDGEQDLINKINRDYEDATAARVSCFCVFIFGSLFISFVFGAIFGKPFLDFTSGFF